MNNKSNFKQNPTAGALLELLFKTTHHLHRQFENTLNTFDTPSALTGPRLRFLITVEEAGQIRMSDIAAKLGIQPRTVTQFVDALEKEDYLIRISDPEDRRATLLKVAPQALKDIKKARASMSLAAEKTLAYLPEEQRIQLYNLLFELKQEENV